MDRRTFLGTLGTSIAVTVAGCIESGSGGDGAGGRGGDGTDPTDTTGAAGSGTTTGATGSTETTDGSRDSATGTAKEPTGTPTAGGQTPTDGSLAVADTTFEVTSSECGGGVDEASVAIDGDTVTVEGTIGGRNGCETARIAEATVRSGTLAVAVETYVPETDEPKGCTQCLVDIRYTATVTVDGGTLDAVVVEHGDERVTETAS